MDKKNKSIDDKKWDKEKTVDPKIPSDYKGQSINISFGHNLSTDATSDGDIVTRTMKYTKFSKKLLTKKSYGQHIIFREPIICPVCNTSLNVKITQSPCLLVEKRGFKNLPKVLKKIIVKNFTDHALGFIILADIAIALMLIFATNPPDHPFRSFLYETTAINAVIFLITCFVAFRYYFRPVALLFKGKNIAEKCPEIKNKLIDVILKVKLPDIFKESENCAQSEIDESYSFRHYIVENDQSDYEIMKRKQSADVPYENPCLKPGIWMLDVSC